MVRALWLTGGLLVSCASAPRGRPPEDGMTRPKLDTAALLEGLPTAELKPPGVVDLTIRCHALVSGVIEKCVEIEPLAQPDGGARPKEATPLGAAVIERLHSAKVSPARYKGSPINIAYVLRFRFQ